MSVSLWNPLAWWHADSCPAYRDGPARCNKQGQQRAYRGPKSHPSIRWRAMIAAGVIVMVGHLMLPVARTHAQEPQTQPEATGQADAAEGSSPAQQQDQRNQAQQRDQAQSQGQGQQAQGQGQPSQQVPPEIRRVLGQFQRAMVLVEQGRTDAALALLNEIAQSGQPLPGSLVHAVKLLQRQIDGSFAQLQETWLKRDIVSTVVIVPDELSFAHALAAWDEQTMFPILYEDPWFNALFIEAFEPERVVRYVVEPGDLAEAGDAAGQDDGPGQANASGQDEQDGGDGQTDVSNMPEWAPQADAAEQPNAEQSNAELANAEQPNAEQPNAELDPGAKALVDLLNVHQRQMVQLRQQATSPTWAPGTVVVDLDSPQRGAALALAIGRGQPVIGLKPQFTLRQVVAQQDIEGLNQNLLRGLMQWRLIGSGHWTALTWVGDLPWKYNASEPGENKHARRAVDDWLARESNGLRVGVLGRLLGDRQQVTYQAMASLFLQPQRMLMHNSYNLDPQTVWGQYRLDAAKQMFSEAQINVTLQQIPHRRLSDWLDAIRPVHAFDWIWLNSSGGSSKFRGGGESDDFPFGRACAMHVIHSHSNTSPWRAPSLAARAILGGAYWYFGATDEPYLTAFVRPTGWATKVLAGTPLAFASRQMPMTPLSRPWRTALIGDPLYSYRHMPARRVAQLPEAIGKRGAVEPVDFKAMIEPATSLDQAVKALDAAADQSSDAVLLQAWRAWKGGQYQALLALSPELARSDPRIAWMTRLAAHRVIDQRVAEGDLTGAMQALALRVQLGGQARQVPGALNRIVSLARKQQRVDQVKDQLEQFKASPGASGQVRKAIDGVIGKL